MIKNSIIKKLGIVLVTCLFLCFTEVTSQTYSYCPGDSIYLGLANYTGSLQWQQSSDSVNWTNIPGATFSPYGFVFSTDKYYRAMVTAANCNPVYSPVRHTVLGVGCQPQYPAGSVFCNGPTAIVDVVNPVTGKTWMDRNLGASQVATSSTDSLAYGDLYQWGRGSDGHQCRNSLTSTSLSTSDQPGNPFFIITSNTPYDWRSPQNSNLWQGVTGVNNPCPGGYRLPTQTEFEAEALTWSTSNTSGAINSPLKFTAGGLRYQSGSFGNVSTDGLYWYSTFSGSDSKYLNINNINFVTVAYIRGIGASVRCIKETSGVIGSLDCNNYNLVGNLISGQAASNVIVSLPYLGGNGGYYSSQIVSSTGVSGLSAILSQGIFSNGSGNLIYTITGTPATNGVASFNLTIGGQTCTLNLNVSSLAAMYPLGSVFCNNPTAIVEVINPATGKTWMDRNLGASQVASSSTDANSYGDLYQWGRGNDGHQCRNSATSFTLSSADQPGNSNFILTSATPHDWRTPQNSNLWQGVNGANNPCPTGYRLPTEIELNSERVSFSTQDAAGAFASPLKLPLSGSRFYYDGILVYVGTNVSYWSSTVNSTDASALSIDSTAVNMNAYYRSIGLSVRCIKN